jgi:hypothetical protein
MLIACVLGTGSTYQWQKNGGNITGATGATLTLYSVKETDCGDYSVIVGDAVGSVSSNVATLTVQPLPVISIQSAVRQLLHPGQSLSMSVKAAGTGSLNYQWHRNNRPISGQNAPTYNNSSGVTMADSGIYTVAVTDNVGTKRASIYVLVMPSSAQIREWGYGGETSRDLANVMAVSAGGDHSLELKPDGTVVAWGSNSNGQASVPIGLTDVVAVSAGGFDSLALKADGTVVKWGISNYGLDTVSGLTDVVAVSAGGSNHFLALKADGTMVEWGYARSTYPAGLTNVVAISAGYSHSMALRDPSGDLAPSVASQTSSQSVDVGRSATFTVIAAGAPPPTMQWQVTTDGGATWKDLYDGALYSGVTTGTLTVTGVTREMNNYQFRCALTNFEGSANSTAATLTVMGSAASRLSALAVRTESGPGADVLIVGVIVSGASGSEKKEVIVRGVGPGLQQSGVANFLSDPEARVYSGSTVIASNDDWDSSAMKPALAAVGLDTLANGSKDAAMLAQLADGGYTVQVGAKTNENGVALAEIYESDSTTQSHMSAMAVRAKAGTSEKTLIAGFVIKGTVNKRLVIRGLGPALASALGTGYLADPKLDVYLGSTIIASNDNWGNTQELRTAFASVGLQPMDALSKDAALVVDLPPGRYTIWLTGVNNATGIGLIEIYELP